MEQYAVSAEGITKIKDISQISGEEFSLSIFSQSDLPSLSGRLDCPESAIFKKVSAAIQSEGEDISPFLERINPSLVFICYRDFDSADQQVVVRFFLSANSITILQTDILDLQQIINWAQSGLIKTATELAQMMGMEMLDHFQHQLELVEEEIDRVEEKVIDSPKKWQMSGINKLNKQIIVFKKWLNAHAVIFGRLVAADKTVNEKSTWHELITETQHALDNARQTHELAVNLRETYQQAIDNRANDIMKVLSLWATLLLPLNLITSFFGMNFKYMPLIYEPYGLIFVYALSVLIVCGVWFFFWRNRWTT